MPNPMKTINANHAPTGPTKFFGGLLGGTCKTEMSPEGEELNPGSPEVLFDEAYNNSPLGRGNANYDVASDGRFLMVQGASGGETPPLRVVLNWFEELKERAPGGQ